MPSASPASPPMRRSCPASRAAEAPMPLLTRRDLLRLAGASGVAAVPGLRGLAFAAPAAAPAILVVVHLRGGCDALNLVSPADDPHFVAARPPELRVVAEGPDAGHALPHGPDA